MDDDTIVTKQGSDDDLSDGKTVVMPESASAAGLDDPGEKSLGMLQKLGKYRILELIGQGGMGSIYLALNPNTDERVAIKVLPRALLARKEALERFQREAKIAIQIRHPNVVRVLDADRDEEQGLHYIVMEYVDGQSVEQLHKSLDGPLPWRQAVDISIDVARALEAAAKKNIVHRDIKPSNILISKKGETKLADLGLAKQLEHQTLALTMDDQVVGTPYFMSPEQISPKKAVDKRSDIYSLGATVYQLVTGEFPHKGDSILELARKIMDEAPVPPAERNPEIPVAVERVILKMMAKDPDRRYQTYDTLLADLTALKSGTFDLGAVPASSTVRAPDEDAPAEHGPTPPSAETNAAARDSRGRGAKRIWRIGALAAVLLLTAGFCLALVLGGTPVPVEEKVSSAGVSIVRQLVNLPVTEAARTTAATDFWTSAPRMVRLEVQCNDRLAARLAALGGTNVSQLLNDRMQDTLDDLEIVRITRDDRFARAVEEAIRAATGAFDERYKNRLGQFLSVHQELTLSWEAKGLKGYPLLLELGGVAQETGQVIREKAECPDEQALPAVLKSLTTRIFDRYLREYPLQGRAMDSGLLADQKSIQINIGRYHGVEKGMRFGLHERKERTVGGQNRPYAGIERLAETRVTSVEKGQSMVEILSGDLDGRSPETILVKQIPEE